MNKPILITRFNIASLWSAWTSYGAGIWYTDFSGAYPIVDPLLVAGIDTKLITSAITTVLYRGEDLAQVSSLGALLNGPSFFWDEEPRALYIHLPDYNPPDESIKVGIQVFAGTALYDDQNGRIYDADLLSQPSLEQKKDRLFFNRVATLEWNMDLANTAFKYDGIQDWGAYNQRVSYFLGERDAPFEDFIPIRAGRVRDFSFGANNVSLHIQDLRAALSMKLPTNFLSSDEYAELDEKTIGQGKPLAFGKVFSVAPLCVNKDSPTGPYIYILADSSFGAIKEVTEVRVADAVITPSAINLVAGTITLTSAQVKSGSSFKEVLVDYQGYVDSEGELISNPLDIVKFLLLNITGATYTDSYFDTLEWEAERSGKPAIGLYIQSSQSLLSIIESIMVTLRGGFLITHAGKYTFRTADYTSRPAINILDEDWYEEPEIDYDTEEVLASVEVGYKKNWKDNAYTYIRNTASAKEVLYAFGIQDSETYETLLTEKADAEAYAEGIMALSKQPAIIITGIVSMAFANTQIGTNFQAAVNRRIHNGWKTWLGTVRGEVLKVSPNIDNETVELTLRVVDGVPEYVESSGIMSVYGIGIYGESIYGGVAL